MSESTMLLDGIAATMGGQDRGDLYRGMSDEGGMSDEDCEKLYNSGMGDSSATMGDTYCEKLYNELENIMGDFEDCQSNLNKSKYKRISTELSDRIDELEEAMTEVGSTFSYHSSRNPPPFFG